MHPCLFWQTAFHILTNHRKEDILKNDTPLTPQMHAAHRSVLGQIIWSQPRLNSTFVASFRAARPEQHPQPLRTLAPINKTLRTNDRIPLSMRSWPLRGKSRIVGYLEPQQAYDMSFFLLKTKIFARARPTSAATTTSATVAELHGLMRCCCSSLFISESVF